MKTEVNNDELELNDDDDDDGINVVKIESRIYVLTLVKWYGKFKYGLSGISGDKCGRTKCMFVFCLQSARKSLNVKQLTDVMGMQRGAEMFEKGSSKWNCIHQLQITFGESLLLYHSLSKALNIKVQFYLSFVWVCNCVSQHEKGTRVESTWEQSAEKNNSV